MSILSSNYNILNNIANSLSAISLRNYLSAINPSGTGLFIFDGDIQLSGDLSSNFVYCTNNNMIQTTEKLIELTNTLSGAKTINPGVIIIDNNNYFTNNVILSGDYYLSASNIYFGNNNETIQDKIDDILKRLEELQKK